MSTTRPLHRYPARPTKYRDILFRSALEARWASFLDHIGWEWVYEPDGPYGYIPDFLILGEQQFYLEVKPVYTPAAAAALIESYLLPKIRHWERDLDLVVVGFHPILWTRDQRCEDGKDRLLLTAGVSAGGNLTLQGDQLFWFRNSFRWGIANRREALVSMPCPCPQDQFFPDTPDTRDIDKPWGHATNATRWNQ